MIYTVTLNPAVDKTVYVDNFAIDAVNRATSVRQDAGGKGINVSKTIKALGGESTAVAFLGGPSGAFIASALDEAGIAVRSFEVPGTTRTNTKVVDLASHTYTDINEPGAPVTKALLDDALAILALGINPGDIVVLSGSLPAGADANTYARWTRACRKVGARVFLDADGEALIEGIAARPALIKPNEVELGRMLGRELTEDADIVSAALDEESLLDLARGELAAAIANTFFELTDSFDRRRILRDYKSRSMILGQPVLLYGTSFGELPENGGRGIRARAIDIDENGGLVVEYLEGRRAREMETVTSGEVTVRSGRP